MSQNPYFLLLVVRAVQTPNHTSTLQWLLVSRRSSIPFKFFFCHLDLYPVLENKLGRDYVDSFLSKTTLRDVMLRELQMPFR
jgi:hypothetical protein